MVDPSGSILSTIKKMLGVDENYEPYDTDISVLINSALMVLTQIGVGPEEGFSISGKEETWRDFLGDNMSKAESVKTYIYLKVKVIFDPPGNSFVMSAFNDEAKELEWRLNVRSKEANLQ